MLTLQQMLFDLVSDTFGDGRETVQDKLTTHFESRIFLHLHPQSDHCPLRSRQTHSQ